jgi:hypothetical protein
MSASDILKAALEKKKAANQKPGKKNASGGEKGIGGGQVTTNRPAKKAAGRGR